MLQGCHVLGSVNIMWFCTLENSNNRHTTAYGTAHATDKAFSKMYGIAVIHSSLSTREDFQ